MIKLKTILGEGYAWEREAGKPLPTLEQTTAAYAAKMQEQSNDQDISEPMDDLDEEAKPDYIDADGDGNEEESMKKAFADKEDDLAESTLTKSGLQEMREIPLEQRILRNLKGNDYILSETFKK
jgi:hypothetical protein